jgi:polyisoprenoid-binding protein YceI
MKKSILLPALALLTMSFSLFTNFTVTDEGSSVKFKIKNFGLEVDGGFTGLQGNINFDPNNLTASTFEASLDANTVNTNNKKRDSHLRKKEYFDAVTYPRIKLISTKISNSAKANTYILTGKLTIKNVVKDISFPFTSTQKGSDYLFTGEFKINRRDFGIGGSSISMSDNLTVFLSITGKKK